MWEFLQNHYINFSWLSLCFVNFSCSVVQWFLNCYLGFSSISSASLWLCFVNLFFCFLSYFRLSRWNHTEIFSDFDKETDMDVEKVSGRCGKASSQLKSKSILRWVVIFMLIVNMTRTYMFKKSSVWFALSVHGFWLLSR